jgi:hypothetical protein
MEKFPYVPFPPHLGDDYSEKQLKGHSPTLPPSRLKRPRVFTTSQ